MHRPTDRLDEYIDLWDAIDSLPPKYKAAMLYLSIGMTQVEIGEIMGISQRGAGKLIEKARILLKQF